jgi:hypothetical protein
MLDRTFFYYPLLNRNIHFSEIHKSYHNMSPFQHIGTLIGLSSKESLSLSQRSLQQLLPYLVTALLSALGRDGIGYCHLKFGQDPMIKLIAAIFKDCVEARQIPAMWKRSRTARNLS